MIIGLVCRHFLSTKGGMENYSLALSEALVRQGHAVHVFANTAEKKPDVRLHHVPIFPFSSPGKNLSFAFMAKKRIAECKLDVVQSMERIWSQDIFRASDGINPIQMQEKYPNLLWRTFKSAGPRRQVLSLLERKIFQKGGARWVMTNSVLVKKQIIQYYQFPEEKIVVIYNSVDTGRFNASAKITFRNTIRETFGIGRENHLILFAGNDFQRKGLAVLIKALAKIADTRINLLVAGSDRPGWYQRLASQCGIGANVLFIGHHKNPERLYGSADLFVLPTRYDPFANVCLEAMACGMPVITTEMNGASEIIENGWDGYVLRDGSVDELSARIRDVLFVSDKSAMGQRACEKAKTFTMENHMRQLLDLYACVVEEKKK